MHNISIITVALAATAVILANVRIRLFTYAKLEYLKICLHMYLKNRICMSMVPILELWLEQYFCHSVTGIKV